MKQSIFQTRTKLNIDTTSDEPMSQHTSQWKESTLTNIVRPDLDRLDQMIGKLQRCTSTVNTTYPETMNSQLKSQEQDQNQQSAYRMHSSKSRAPPPPPSLPPPPPLPSAPPVLSFTSDIDDKFSPRISSSLPETFVSSLRQLFSILDKTNTGYVAYDVFKRYWTPSFTMENSSATLDILNELELESKSKNYLIDFDLLLNVIEKSLTSNKQFPSNPPSSVTTNSDSSLSSLSNPPILIPKPTRPNPPISFPLNRSTSVVVVTPTPKRVDQQQQFQQQIPVVYRSYNGEIERNSSKFHESTSNGLVKQRKKVISQRSSKQHSHIYSENQSIPTRRNTIHSNEIDFAMIRAMKRYEIERDLLVQTCDTLDRVKTYLIDRLLEMKDKQHSYSLQLSTAESTGIAPESIYNRDLVADLLKLANTVLAETNYEFKKSSDRSSSSLSSSSINGNMTHPYNTQLKAKEDRIKHLEMEKRVLLKELVEMRHQYRTVIPTKHC